MSLEQRTSLLLLKLLPRTPSDVKRSSIEKYGNGFEEGSGKSTAGEEEEPPSKFSLFYRRYRFGFHIAIAALVTAWYIAALVLHRDEARVVPTLIWAFIILKLFFYHVSTRHFTPIIAKAWNMTFGAFFAAIPQKVKIPLGAFTVLAVFLLAGFLTPVLPGQSLAQRGQAFFGILVFVGLLLATSTNFSKINWRTVLVGLFLQFVVALFVLRTGVGQDIFRWLANEASIFLSFSEAGYSFLFSADNEVTWIFLSLGSFRPLFSSSHLYNSSTTGALCNGSSRRSPGLCFGPWTYQEQRPSWLLRRHLSDR